MAANTDKFKKGARRFTTTVGAGGISDASVTTVPLSSVTGLPTDTAIDIVVDRADASGNLTLSAEEVITGVVSGSNLITCIRGVEGTAQAHTAGAVVEVRLTANQWDDMVDGLIVEHNQDGTHTEVFAESLVPIATMLEFAGTSAPTGFLMCDGTAVLRSTYSGLYAVVGTTYGVGDGSTTFNVPDKRNRTSFGAGDDYTLGDEVGDATKTIAEANMPAHTHTADPANTSVTINEKTGLTGTVSLFTKDSRGLVDDNLPNGIMSGSNSLSGYARPDENFSSPSDSYAGFSINANHSHSGSVNIASFNTGSKGSGTALDVINPGLATNFIIKY